MSNVAAENRFGGKSVATTLSRESHSPSSSSRSSPSSRRFPRGGFPVQILAYKFTVSRSPPRERDRSHDFSRSRMWAADLIAACEAIATTISRIVTLDISAALETPWIRHFPLRAMKNIVCRTTWFLSVKIIFYIYFCIIYFIRQHPKYIVL